MKTTDKQVFAMLKAYDRESVLSAIELYKDDVENEGKLAKKQLMDAGWFPQVKMPEDREFYVIEGKYWVQTDEARERDKKAAIEAYRKEDAAKRNNKSSSKEQDMNLKSIPITCPSCGNKMYKQNVCKGCVEGRQGYKIRLICEDNSDHEVLL